MRVRAVPCLQRVLLAYLVCHMMGCCQYCLGEGLCNTTSPVNPFAAESRVDDPEQMHTKQGKKEHPGGRCPQQAGAQKSELPIAGSCRTPACACGRARIRVFEAAATPWCTCCGRTRTVPIKPMMVCPSHLQFP